MTIPDGWLADWASDLKTSIQFFTRLPVSGGTPAGADLARAAWAFPLAGIVVGLIAAAVYALAYKLGFAGWPAAALTVAATLLVTGCLHEDGLADTVDGFGGGDTQERKLEIMRDSRIGTYGVCALTVSIVLRVAALAAFAGPVLALGADRSARRGARHLAAVHGAANAGAKGRPRPRGRQALGRAGHHRERAGDSDPGDRARPGARHCRADRPSRRRCADGLARSRADRRPDRRRARR